MNVLMREGVWLFYFYFYFYVGGKEKKTRMVRLLQKQKQQDHGWPDHRIAIGHDFNYHEEKTLLRNYTK